MFTLTGWSNRAPRSKEERATERPRLQRTAAVSVLALGVAVLAALAPAGRPAEAGKPICAAVPCPPPEAQRSGAAAVTPQCASAQCPPPPNEQAPQVATAAKPKCVEAMCPPPPDQ
jgi:hypothetical protein